MSAHSRRRRYVLLRPAAGATCATTPARVVVRQVAQETGDRAAREVGHRAGVPDDSGARAAYGELGPGGHRRRRAAGLLADRRGRLRRALVDEGGPAARRWRRCGPRVPPAAVGRLPVYLRALDGARGAGVATTSSGELAELAGVGSAQLRRDLSFLGSHGVRGVGLRRGHLHAQVAAALGSRRTWRW